MKIEAWRIVKAKHAATAFAGDGAKRHGGRWNSPGVAVVYCASSTALAMLEMLVHMQSQDLLRRYVLFAVTFDASLVEAVRSRDLPRGWSRTPPPAAVHRIGDRWIVAGRAPVLRVPSVLVPHESNYLLDPAHPDFARIRIGPKRRMLFDARLRPPR